jgi:hypothetical protein
MWFNTVIIADVITSVQVVEVQEERVNNFGGISYTLVSMEIGKKRDIQVMINHNPYQIVK